MTKRDEVAEIVRVAETIEQELQQLEELSRSVQNARLNTEKNIARAGRTLQQALEQQQQLAVSLRSLGEAMAGMQRRQQSAIEALGVRAQQIQQQALNLADHMQRFAALGTKAAEATRLLQELPVEGETKGATAPAVLLVDIEQLLLALSEEAKALASSADGADLTEVAKEASSLRQRIDSARGRISQLVKGSQQQAN